MISSRTPEGVPNRCPVCGSKVRIEPSSPARDAPCPVCGSLLWFTRPVRRRRQTRTTGRWAGILSVLAGLFVMVAFLLLTSTRFGKMELVVVGVLALLLFGGTLAKAIRWLGRAGRKRL